jgi:hypothetical protein
LLEPHGVSGLASNQEVARSEATGGSVGRLLSDHHEVGSFEIRGQFRPGSPFEFDDGVPRTSQRGHEQSLALKPLEDNSRASRVE